MVKEFLCLMDISSKGTSKMIKWADSERWEQTVENFTRDNGSIIKRMVKDSILGRMGIIIKVPTKMGSEMDSVKWSTATEKNMKGIGRRDWRMAKENMFLLDGWRKDNGKEVNLCVNCKKIQNECDLIFANINKKIYFENAQIRSSWLIWF